MARIYLTTPIYYVNDRPHIGHAYTSLATDVMARWKRLEGHEVMFLTGTDEHGQKVEKAARDAGMEPQAFTDQVSGHFRTLAARMNLSNDDFIRTTEPRHHRACQALWEELVRRGEIYLGHYEGWYAVRDEAFYGPDELTERDGVRYAPSGAPVEWVREPSYFFRLSKWQDWLLDYYTRENPGFIAPAARRNEVMRFVEGGLADLSVSRTSFRWGIPVPGDADHVMYVWMDALTNYVTAAGYPDTQAPRWPFWADGQVTHFVGKDIVRFHTIYWPAFLKAAGVEPPGRVFAHGWWTIEGQKMSKSLGNAIDPLALIDEYGLDPLRYFLLREVPFGQDGDFQKKALVARLNGELADGLGNLAQRTLSLIQRNCEGRLPAAADGAQADAALLGGVAALPGTVARHIDAQEFHLALEAVMAEVRGANGYITQQQPWALRKTDPARMLVVLRHLHSAIRSFATVLHPFMPQTMAAMLDQLGVPADARTLAALAVPLPEGTALPAPAPLFRKIDDAA